MQKTKNEAVTGDSVIEEMFKAGAHYGYSKTRRHPSVSEFIYATKNRSDIINLEKTSEMLATAAEFARSLGAKGTTLLFVGTKPEAKNAVEAAAMSVSMPFATARWIGGTLSNWSEIKKRIAELENYRKERAEGGLEKYTKKERLMLARKMEKLEKYYSGLVGLKKIPEALFVVDADAEAIAVAEARGVGAKVIALTNSDSNIKSIQYPILGNDASIPSIRFFAAHIAAAYKKGTSEIKNADPNKN